MRILFIGDIVGKPGRKAVRRLLPRIRDKYAPDVVLANGENMAGGAGITRDTAQEMFTLGVAALTTGNHVWDQREAVEYLAEDVPIVRPLNYPPGAPGTGCIEVQTPVGVLTVVNVQGRVFMRPLDDPFRAMDSLLESMGGRDHIFVDMHAEATGEKQALGFHLDGRVSAVIGTHTHVQTADARILPRGTAYITDVGMTGPRDSVIGVEPGPVIQRYITQMYHRYDVAKGPVLFCAVLIDLDDDTGRARQIMPVQEVLEV